MCRFKINPQLGANESIRAREQKTIELYGRGHHNAHLKLEELQNRCNIRRNINPENGSENRINEYEHICEQSHHTLRLSLMMALLLSCRLSALSKKLLIIACGIVRCIPQGIQLGPNVSN